MNLLLVNEVARRLANLFPGFGFGNGSTKHNHYTDYGWPEQVEFSFFYKMYTRNGLAAAAADRLSLRTWKTLPEFIQTEKPEESKEEKEFRQRMEDIRGYQALIETDLRAFVGGYAGALLRVADNGTFDQPVTKVPGGVDGLVEIVPVWRGQIFVKAWNENKASPDYGQPIMYSFRENALPGANVSGAANGQPTQGREFDVHPDRLLLWSADGTVFARSNLEAGYNSLLDAEKIVGAGGEGFWKNAKSAPVLQAAENFNAAAMAQALGTTPDLIKKAMSERVENWQQGFDKLLFTQGIDVKTLGVTLPQPNEFFMMAANMFAASVSMPVRVLIGNQTGERASTEDQIDFNMTCMARRERLIVPMLRDLLNRLEKWGIIKGDKWAINWESLMGSSPTEKMARAKSMAEINAASQGPMGESEPIFSVDEIRGEVDMAPREETGGDDE